MKLDSKQMHILSQLFMTASKAGHSFDLSRLIKDPSYARDTLAKLTMAADTSQNEAFQGLVLLALEVMAAATPPPSVASTLASTAPPPPPANSAPASSQQRYVGQLR